MKLGVVPLLFYLGKAEEDRKDLLSSPRTRHVEMNGVMVDMNEATGRNRQQAEQENRGCSSSCCRL